MRSILVATLQEGCEALERVQKRFTRLLPGLMLRLARLDKLGLFSLERRRLREDLIEIYKIMRDIDRVDSQNLFPRVEISNTRGHALKVRGGKFKGNVRGKFFTQRVVGVWNMLPGVVMEADTIGLFNGAFR